MNLLEKVGHFISKRGDYIQEQISGKRVFLAHVTNATDEVLELSGKPMVSYGRCNHFSRLMPGEAGNLSFEHDGEHGGAFEFSLGKERFFVGQYMRASYSSLFGSDQFVMEFSNKTLKQFYMNMPQQFMGARGPSRTESQKHAAIVRKATDSNLNQVEILLVPSKDVHIFEDLDQLDSLQHLALAEMCGPELLGSAVFLEEFAALRDSLEHSKCYEQVYACDLLVDRMVATGFCGKASQEACAAWRNSRAKFPAATFKLAPYRYFQQLPDELLEVHLNICHGLLRSTALRCGEKLEPMVQQLKAKGEWPPALQLQSVKAVEAVGEIGFATNDAIMATHLQNDDPQKGESRASVCAGESAESADRFLQSLVRLCVTTSCTSLLRRQRLLDSLDAEQLKAYMRHIPLSRRSAVLKHNLKPEGQKFEVFCAEIFHTLEEQTSASALLESLGESSGEYKSLSTNSKSGEFFFLSHDRKFLIKTVSEAEGRLLFRMLPEYQDHIHSLPASLIVRFAGLYHVEVGNGSWKYFLVMKSVFDPSCEIHAHYDLKGSLYHRKKKEGESCGKDEDWIKAKLLVQVPEQRRRQMLEAHEADVSFLKSHHVMDYSVLVGIHYPDRGTTSPKHAGIAAASGKEVYFLGLIDFLIHFGLRKQAEHLLRAAQGHGQDTSCVDPADYAARQARFLRSSVFPPLDPDMGTAGILKVQVISAKNLRNADIIGASDPYVIVSVGLQSAQTHVIKDNLNPTWNCTLQLPLNHSHFGQDVQFSVWDKDFVRTAQGSDDFLGRLRLPMANLLQHRAAELNQRLEETSKGELHIKAWLEHEVQGGYPNALPSAVWEFEVRAGFESFDPSCQKILEDLYQASLAGGAASVQVRSGAVDVWVDFRAMTQQVRGSTRLRPVRRRSVRQS